MSMLTNPQPMPVALPQTGSLFVGSLAPNVNEEDIYNTFNPIGRVISVHICRDKNTKQSLGYGYVNYANYQDAERAKETLNYNMIGGKACRIMFQNKDPSTRKEGIGNVYVRNLPESIDDKTLTDIFSVIGNILSNKVAMDQKTGKSLGYGYVQYSDPEHAKLAIEKMNGHVCEGHTITVEPYKPRRGIEWTNVYFAKAPIEWDEATVKATFDKYGASNSILVRHVEGDNPRVFGYVNFDDHAAAIAAVEGLNEKDFGTEASPLKLMVSRYQNRKEREKAKTERKARMREERQAEYKGKNLYVKNFGQEFTDANLRELFSVHGTITSSVIMKSPEGASKGFGFVCYNSVEEANKAINLLHNMSLNGRALYVTLSQTQEERRRQRMASAIRYTQPNLITPYPQMMMPQMDNRMGMMPYRMFPYPQGQQFAPPNPRRYPNQNRQMKPMPSRSPINQQQQQPQQQQQQQRQQQPMRPMQPPYPQMAGAGPMNLSQASLAPNMVASMANTSMQRMMNTSMSMPMGAQMGPQVGQQMGAQMGFSQQPIASNQSMVPIAAPPNDERLIAKIDEAIKSHVPLEPALVLSMQPDERRNVIGERLFHLINAMGEPRVPKITGMMLELEPEQLLGLVQSAQDLYYKIVEATQVLDGPPN